MDSAILKKLLYEHCERFLQERISNIQQAMENARAAQQDDTKSSAGDKYETTREMMTQELENLSTQLHQLLVQLNILQSLQLDKKNESAEAGSLVKTDKGFYFISIGSGTAEIEGKNIVCISPAAPLAVAMLGKTEGESFLFRNMSYKVLSVH
jgi:transcription elongation GreA/GreB family factor